MRNTALSFAALAALCLAPAARADTLIVTAARMVDVLAGREVEHPQIVIAEGRITSVGRAGEASARLSIRMSV